MKPSSNPCLWFIALTSFATLHQAQTSAGVIYVNRAANGANNGTSWADAFTNLHVGIAAAQTGDQIWIAAGRYDESSFLLKAGVNLFGGFAGNESSLDERDLKNHKTILAGGVHVGGEHVVRATDLSAPVTLDGLTIQDGFSQPYQGDLKGGGALIERSQVIFRNCEISRNTSSDGAGVAVIGGSAVDRVAFINCSILFNYGHPPCDGKDCGTTADGGGIYCDNASLLLVNCLVVGNVAGDGWSWPDWGGPGGSGGGVYYRTTHPSERLQIINCTFSRNYPGDGGDAGSKGNDGYPGQSGGVNAVSTNPSLFVNSIAWGNGPAPLMGVTVLHSCVEGWSGGGAQGNIGADPLFRQPSTFRYRLAPGSPCVDAGDNALLPSDEFDLDGDGDTTEPLPLDLRFAPRAVDYSLHASDGRFGSQTGQVDMGAFESLIDCNLNLVPDDEEVTSGSSEDADGNGVPDECDTPAVRVRQGATGAHNGLSWADAFTDLQDAVEHAVFDSTPAKSVWVAAGSYLPVTGFHNVLSGPVELVSGVSLYGGFSGTETSVEQRDPATHRTLLHGDREGDDGPNGEHTNGNFRTILRGAGVHSVLVDGFTIASNYGGAAVDLTDSSIMLRQCVFTLNGITIEFQPGNALLVKRGAATLSDCVFVKNRGRAVFVYNGDVSMQRCAFVENGRANFYTAAAVYANGDDYSLRFESCLFIGNKARFNAAIKVDAATTANADVAINHCTFYRNNATTGQSVWMSPPSHGAMRDCILYGNTPSNLSTFGNIDVAFSLVQGGWPGVGNLSGDPGFVDPIGPDGVAGTADDDLRLAGASSCIDAGDPSIFPPFGSTDLDGSPRVQCGRADMGAYESGDGTAFGDFHNDGGIDLFDYGAMAACTTGPGGGLILDDCHTLDFDCDQDVDVLDFRGFQLLLHRP